MKYNVAVIGCGLAGSEYDRSVPQRYAFSHSGAYYLNKNTHLVAVCDIDIKKAKKAKNKWGCKAYYTSVTELLKNEKLDIISICSSTQSHLAVMQQVINSSVKTVLLEKPISYNYKEAIKLQNLLAKSDLNVAVNYQRRWDPSLINLKKLFDEGLFGSIQKINVFYTLGIIHIGSHAVDLIRWFFGEPFSVISFSHIKNNIKDPLIDVCYRMKSEFNFYLQGFKRDNFNIFEIDIIAEKARIKLLKGGRKIEWYLVDNDPLYKHLKLLKRKRQLIQNKSKYALTEAIKDMVRISKNNNKPRCTYIDGMKTLQTALYGIESAKNKGKEILINES